MMTEKTNYESQLQKFYENHKQKKYYTTSEVMLKTGICLRTLRYRISKLKVKYKNVPNLLYKKDNKWFIHRQILQEFVPKIRRSKTLFNMNWKTFVTWIMADGYDNDYHIQLTKEIKEALPQGNFDFVIEKTKKGVNHVHMVTDLECGEIAVTVEEVISNYLPEKDFRLQIEKVRSAALTRNYMNK